MTRNPSLETIDREMARAERAVERARIRGAPIHEIEKLELRLRALQHAGQNKVAEVHRYRHMAYFLPNGAVSRATQQVIDAMDRQDHWLAKSYRADLVRMVQGNGRIPNAYKEQLPSDLARVLRVCPDALGLVKELSLRGQKGATASRSKLGSRGNSAIGAAYEIMGTAALTRKVLTAGNTGFGLHVSTGNDRVVFGEKMYPSPAWGISRKSSENDISILKKNGDHIGVDFKHTKDAGMRGRSKDTAAQVEHVCAALSEGIIHEYHFVTNGKFSEPFKQMIATANASLPKHARPISYHEYVSTLVSDPASDGAAS